MRKSDVIEYFGTPSKVAEAIGVSIAAVSQWKDRIPERSAYRVQDATSGALRVDPSMYPRRAARGTVEAAA